MLNPFPFRENPTVHSTFLTLHEEKIVKNHEVFLNFILKEVRLAVYFFSLFPKGFGSETFFFLFVCSQSQVNPAE